MQIHVYKHIPGTCACTRTNTHPHMQGGSSARAHTHTHTRTHTGTHIHRHTITQTHKHIYTDTHIHLCPRPLQVLGENFSDFQRGYFNLQGYVHSLCHFLFSPKSTRRPFIPGYAKRPRATSQLLTVLFTSKKVSNLETINWKVKLEVQVTMVIPGHSIPLSKNSTHELLSSYVCRPWFHVHFRVAFESYRQASGARIHHQNLRMQMKRRSTSDL